MPNRPREESRLLGFPTLPPFCRVKANLMPTNDSAITMELWLPTTWNGKFNGVGNGGWGGNLPYPALVSPVAAGYAAAVTDTGHVGGGAEFALGHPEKLIDFGYRATHEMAVLSKAIVRAFYGAAPRFSYFDGCSGAGRQGLAAAERYASDFDGITAIAPVLGKLVTHAGRIALNAGLERQRH